MLFRILAGGAAVIVLGLGLDLAYHIGETQPSPMPGSGVGLLGHVVTLAGMVIAVFGLIGMGLVAPRSTIGGGRRRR